MTNIQLYNDDCFNIFPQIADKSVDMICCDLPYGTTACKWDSVLQLWKEYERVIKDNGAIVLFGSQSFTTIMINSNIKHFREELIWLKNKGGSGMSKDNRHIKIHENIEVFSINGTYTYNPQKWLVDKKEFLTQRKTFNDNEFVGSNVYGNTHRSQPRKEDDGTRYPISILSARTPHSPSISKIYDYEKNDIRFHPTQKPIALLEYLIKTYSNEGDLVLDNCMGSGTCGVACKKLNRNFIGVEKEKNYFEIAQKRINDVKIVSTSNNEVNNTNGEINNTLF